MTRAEHEALLKAEGRYDSMIERQRQREKEWQEREAELRRAEAPLLSELQAAGYSVKSVWDLVNGSGSYSSALPILLNHLTQPYPAPVRDGIARALAVPEARFGWNTLIREFRSEKERRPKDGLACAIAAAANDDVIGDVIELIKDSTYPGRILLLSALEHSADPRARATLMELGSDPDLKSEAQRILRRLKKTS